MGEIKKWNMGIHLHNDYLSDVLDKIYERVCYVTVTLTTSYVCSSFP